MIITVKNKVPLNLIEAHLNKEFNYESRFKLRIVHVGPSRLKLESVRLRQSKEYCGNHPNECARNEGKPQRRNYLEGTDWVEFNDRINDVLDHLEVDAWVRSSIVEIRKGRSRRINYTSHFINNFIGYQWDQFGEEDDYEDCIGRYSPASTYPFGTPGEYLRKANA